MNFPIEESDGNDLITQSLETPKRGQNLLFSITLIQPVRINNPGAPLLGLAKSIYYILYVV